MNLWLIPAADDASRANITKTLSAPISTERAKKANISAGAYAWGARASSPTSINKFDRMSPGDWCLFYTQAQEGGNKRYHWKARISHKERSKTVAEALWDNSEFELVYFLEDVQKIGVTTEQISTGFSEFRPDYFAEAPKGFVSVDPEVVRAIIQKYGDIQSWFDTLAPRKALRFWVEKTLVRDRPDRQSGDHALGKALWSPRLAKGDRDLYRLMREVKSGDVIFHFIDNEAVNSFSVAKAQADSSFIGIEGTEWAGRPAYRIPLEQHEEIVPPIHRKEFLVEPRYRTLIEELLASENGLFFNREFNLNQGSYITEAPLKLVQIWNDIHIRQTGKPLHAAWNIPLLEPEIQQPQSNFAELLRRYHDEQVIFNSSAQQARYAITSWDKDGVGVARLDANEPQRVTFAQAEKLVQRVKDAGGFEFTALDNTSAVRNTVLQAETLALTADRKTIHYLADKTTCLQNFLQVLDALNMANPLYKPAMLLCVLDGIEEGDLSNNRITFDWVAPRFIARLGTLGKIVTEREAAQPFYHLSGDLFWMHAVQNLKDLMQAGGDGPNAARQKIKYALFKDTYWNLLQDPASRKEIRRKLELLIMPKLSPDQILPAAQAAISKTGFLHSPDLIARFISAVVTKPFVILTGNSGTGKTKLAQLFAHWLTGSEDPLQNRYAVVPIGADWTDNRNVVGFVNHLRKDSQQKPIYQSTPVLDLLLRAGADPSRPYFLVLDEMNLSHVERYFSDFLSAMESKEPIPLHDEKEDLLTASGVTVRKAINFPENLFVIGTVNVDETTYMFSPKVLDRANVLEFRIAPQQVEEFFQSTHNHVAPIAPNLGAALGFLELSLQARGLTQPTLASLDKGALFECQQSLQDLFSLLHHARLEFAFRTLAEVLRYLQVDRVISANPSNWQWQSCLDAQILQKILPKLHGSRRRLEKILVALAAYCEKRDVISAQKHLQRDANVTNFQAATSQTETAFPLSHTKLIEMIDAVRRDQFVSYIQ